MKVMFLLLLLTPPVGASGQEMQIPKLSRYATDLTGTLSGFELSRLETKLKSFDEQTSTQIVVVIVPTIGDRTIEEASLKVAELNQIGREGKDNGALLFVAKNDRALRIEVAYGLEGVLTDAIASTIIRRVIIPQFKDGNYYAGIDAGVDAMIIATRDEFKADAVEPEDSLADIIPLVIVMGFFFILMSRLLRGRRGILGVPGPFYGSGRRSYGGGFSGGFKGGGGSFGGGGASGRW